MDGMRTAIRRQKKVGGKEGNINISEEERQTKECLPRASLLQGRWNKPEQRCSCELLNHETRFWWPSSILSNLVAFARLY